MFRRYSTVLTEYESFKNTMQKNITSKNKEYKIISELKNKNKFYENQIKNLKDNINTLNNIIEEQNKKRQIEDQEESLNREKIINNEIKENEIIDKGIDLYSLLIDSEENKEEIKDENNENDSFNKMITYTKTKTKKVNKKSEENVILEENDDDEEEKKNEVILNKEKIDEMQAYDSYSIKDFIATLNFYGNDVSLEKHRPNREKYPVGKAQEPLIKIAISQFMEHIEKKIQSDPELSKKLNRPTKKIY